MIGANGSGKSTLLKVIAGEEQSGTGRVIISKRKCNCHAFTESTLRPVSAFFSDH
ncbi:MAG: ATP-binding cassette domain-containing protein [Acidobacteriota bacterium]